MELQPDTADFSAPAFRRALRAERLQRRPCPTTGGPIGAMPPLTPIPTRLLGPILGTGGDGNSNADPDYQDDWAERANRPAGVWHKRYGLTGPVDPASPMASFVGWPLYWVQPRG